MGKPTARSILYRLIAAGQLARGALLVPLVKRGLEPGDDAVLFLLRDEPGIAERDLSEELAIAPAALAQRLSRLADHGLVERRAVGPTLLPGHVLTARGERFASRLADNWAVLEDALLAELSRKQRKSLRRRLGRFLELLRLSAAADARAGDRRA